MESIFDAIKDAALIHKSGGGTGFCFSRLRPPERPRAHHQAASPAGRSRSCRCSTSPPRPSSRAARGAAPTWASCASTTRTSCEFITRQGRRAHPQQLQHLGGASPRPSCAAVRDEDDYALRQPARPARGARGSSAREVFDLIVTLAWKNGEPGIVFLDRINRDNPTPHARGDRERPTPASPATPLIYTDSGPGAASSTCSTAQRLPAGRRRPHGRRLARRLATRVGLFTGFKPVVRVTTAKATRSGSPPEHRVMTERGWVPAGELQPGDRIAHAGPQGRLRARRARGAWAACWAGWSATAPSRPTGRCCRSGATRSRAGAAVRRGRRGRGATAEQARPEPTRRRGYESPSATSPGAVERVCARSPRSTAWSSEKLMVPEPVLRGSEDMQRGFLQALFTADGTVLDRREKGERPARRQSVSTCCRRPAAAAATSASSVASTATASASRDDAASRRQGRHQGLRGQPVPRAASLPAAAWCVRRARSAS